MKRLFLSMSALLLICVIGPSMLLAADINVTLTYVDDKLVWTPDGPYTYTTGDRFVVTNDTGFGILVEIKSASGYVLHSTDVPNGYTGYLPLNLGLERWVCVTYTPPGGAKGEVTECKGLVLSSEAPTLSEWGLIVLATVIIGIGAMTLLRSKNGVR